MAARGVYGYCSFMPSQCNGARRHLRICRIRLEVSKEG